MIKIDNKRMKVSDFGHDIQEFSPPEPKQESSPKVTQDSVTKPYVTFNYQDDEGSQDQKMDSEGDKNFFNRFSPICGSRVKKIRYHLDSLKDLMLSDHERLLIHISQNLYNFKEDKCQKVS